MNKNDIIAISEAYTGIQSKDQNTEKYNLIDKVKKDHFFKGFLRRNGWDTLQPEELDRLALAWGESAELEASYDKPPYS